MLEKDYCSCYNISWSYNPPMPPACRQAGQAGIKNYFL